MRGAEALAHSVEAQRELDQIFTLLCCSIVYRDWQPDSIPRSKRRGYNVGALLVAPDGRPVHHGLNAINSTENATQHGEVRAIIEYLDRTRQFHLQGYSLYVSLEPCIMCAGMITMTSVSRVVYAQHDVAFSKAFERLSLDSRAIGGFPPYPRVTAAESAPLELVHELDEAYQRFLEADEEKILAKFLASETARSLFYKAHNQLLSFSAATESGKMALAFALAYPSS